MSRLISDYGAAFFALMDDNVSALGIGLCLDCAENSAAGICTVTGVYVNVKRGEAEGAMVARGVSKREYLLAAALAYKALVELRKSFS